MSNVQGELVGQINIWWGGGGGDKNLVGGYLLGEGGGDEQIFGLWGGLPHPLISDLKFKNT